MAKKKTEKIKFNVQETAAGFVGYGWTGKGTAAVTLPNDSYLEALVQLERATGRSKSGILPVEAAAGEAAFGLGDALQDYFKGQAVDFGLFQVDYSFYTPFQARVLHAIRQVPRGGVVSYGQVAAMVGSPRACRAVGGALSANRVLCLVPCHRVVKSDGSLGGFGSSLDWKRALLNLEGVRGKNYKKFFINPEAGGKEIGVR